MRASAVNQSWHVPNDVILHIIFALPIYLILIMIRMMSFSGQTSDYTQLAWIVSVVGGVALVVMPALSPMLALVMMVLAGRFELAPLWLGLTDVFFLLAAGFSIVIIRRLVFPKPGSPHFLFNIHPLIVGSGLFSLVYFTQYVANPISDYSLEKTVRVSCYAFVLLLLTAHLVTSPDARMKFSRLYLVVIAAMSGLALTLAIAQHGLLGIQRIVPIGGGPITLGRFTGFAALLCLAIFMRNGNKLNLIGFMWFTAITLLNGSRGPLLALVLTVVFFVGPSLWVSSIRRRFAKLLVFLWGAFILLVVAFGLAVSAGAPFAGRYVLLVSDERGGAGVGSRLDWVSQTREFLELAPASGNGIGSWAKLIGSQSPNSYPHNMLTELLVENGLFATTFLVVIIVCGFLVGGKLLLHAQTPQQYSDAMIGLGLLFFSLVGAQVSGDLWDNRYIWVSIGWITALRYCITARKVAKRLNKQT